MVFIGPGKPTQNAYTESFNGKFRDECLSMHWFLSLAHARLTVEGWRAEFARAFAHYNREIPAAAS